MLVGKNLVEEGHAYNHAKNMKLRTTIVEEALALTNSDQAKSSSRVNKYICGKLCMISSIQLRLILGHPGINSMP